jgi:energy-coupling factor transporter ATP-binding protein EcfA2
MRITRIFVEKLFGIFDHEIPLNLDDRITIVHAPNGYGKTIMLKLLNGLFNSQYTELLTIPYKSFCVEFDDGRRLKVHRESEDERKSTPSKSSLSFTLYSNCKKKSKSFVIQYDRSNSGSDFSLDTYEPYTSMTSTRLYSKWFDRLAEADIVISRDLEQMSGQMSLPLVPGGQEEQWLKEIREEINIYFIESQRLLNLSSDGSQKKYKKGAQDIPQSTVNTYSNELIQEIKERLAKYASVSQSLDRSFPARVLRQKMSDELTNRDLRNKWDALEKHRNRLVEAGLLEKDEEQNLSMKALKMFWLYILRM